MGRKTLHSLYSHEEPQRRHRLVYSCMGDLTLSNRNSKYQKPSSLLEICQVLLERIDVCLSDNKRLAIVTGDDLVMLWRELESFGMWTSIVGSEEEFHVPTDAGCGTEGGAKVGRNKTASSLSA